MALTLVNTENKHNIKDIRLSIVEISRCNTVYIGNQTDFLSNFFWWFSVKKKLRNHGIAFMRLIRANSYSLAAILTSHSMRERRYVHIVVSSR